MKYISMIFILLILFSTGVSAQIISQFENEPTTEELGAPIFPEAVFIRNSTLLNPRYETAVYISSDTMETVKEFFAKELQEKRVINFSDDDTNLTAYVLRDRSRFPTNPTKDELMELENEPTVQIIQYDPVKYEPLAVFFERSPIGKDKAETIRNGETMIRYTYIRPERDINFPSIVASWRETSRGLREYFGSTLKFNEDGTYIFTLSPFNISEMAKNPRVIENLGVENEEEAKIHLTENNPEIGKYAIIRNSITMSSDNPVDGQRIKSGIANVGPTMLSLILNDRPRLTFLKSLTRPMPPPGIRN